MTTSPDPSAASAYQRDPNVDEEDFDQDLLLMHRERRSVAALNPAAAALWEALRWPQSRSDLCALMTEAMPEMSAEAAEAQVDEILQFLIEGGYVIPAEP